MKRRITLSIAVVLSVVMLALISSDSTAKAQPGRTFVADTGVITLGPNQILRITVANGLNEATVRFRRLEYLQGSCDGGVCKHIITSETTSNPITLAPGEAASTNFTADDDPDHIRYVVTSNRQNMKVNVLIIKTSTGEVVSWGASEIDLKELIDV